MFVYNITFTSSIVTAKWYLRKGTLLGTVAKDDNETDLFLLALGGSL